MIEPPPSLSTPRRHCWALLGKSGLLLGALLGQLSVAGAAAYTWSGPGTDWNTSGNWNVAGYPGSSGTNDTALFFFTGPATTNVSAPVSISSVTFNGLGNTLSGADITLNGTGSPALDFNSGSANSNVIIGNNLIFTGANAQIRSAVGPLLASQNLILNGDLSGSTPLGISTANSTVVINGSLSNSSTISINGNVTLGGSITGAGGIVTVTGTGALNLANNSGGGSAVTTINRAVTVDGGTLLTTGAAAGQDQAVAGALTLTNNSTIDFGSLGETLRFADSTGLWTAGTTLSVVNYGVGTDHLFFGNVTGAGVDTGQLGQISFYSGSSVGSGFLGDGNYLAGGEVGVSPVPEPSSVIIGLGLVGMVGWRERRRLALMLRGCWK